MTMPLLQDPAETTLHTETVFRFLAAPPLWVIALIVVPGAAAFAWWSYTGLKRMESRSRAVLAAFRCLAILFCCALLFQPAWETTTWRRTRSQVHVLVDDSASMQRKDTYPEGEEREALAAVPGVTDVAATNRSQLVRAVLGQPGGLLDQLAKNHDVRLFRVQRQPVAMRSLDDLTARGQRTQLGDALDLHLGTAGGADLEAVVLVSDGRNNAGLDPVEVAAKYAMRGIPVHTLGVGDPEAPRNAWITGPAGPAEALREEQVAFDVTVRAEGLAGRTARVELVGSRDGGAFVPLTSADAALGPDGEAVKVRLYHAFAEAGDWTLRFQLAALPEESQVDDNVDTRFLRVNDEKIRVLYVEERPRWEYRYLKNALLRVDPSIEVQVVLFDANPMFEQEHSKTLPPLRDIPRTEKELMQYHVVLLGDVNPERLAPTEEGIRSWLELLVRFVEFGGGAGFLYGDAAMPERYRNTPLQDLLPVVLEDPLWLAANKPPRDKPFWPVLDNPDSPPDILLLQRDIALNKRLWQEGLQGFVVYHPVLRAKPGATVLFRHPTDANRYGKRPIAVTSPMPRGNTFFLGTDETWRWRNPYGETYMDAFWRNVVRQLASGRLQRRDDLLELTLDRNLLETGDKLRVTLRVLGEELQPASASEQVVFLRKEDGNVERRALRAVPGEPGSFQATFTMADPGAFSFLVHANQNPADRVLARADVLVRIPDRELADSSQDAETLRRISEASSGPDAKARSLFLAQASLLAEDFAGRKPHESREESQTRPAWDSGWSLAVLLLLLGIEWILRKRARLV